MVFAKQADRQQPVITIVISFEGETQIAPGLLILAAIGRMEQSQLHYRAENESVSGLILAGCPSLDSLRIMDLLLGRRDHIPTTRELRLSYPLAFFREMAAVGTEKRLSLLLFYALVREESYFDSGIKSNAGAIGLSQLMPATARELAARLRIPLADLTDPSFNLKLGGQYLRWLMDTFRENGLFALAAYNAGQGRVAGWQRGLAGLPAVLGVEALPFTETREYIRKVTLSTSRYGQLYWFLPPQETVRLIFPELSRMKS
jgi:soluble lytic murein transglycosylase